MTLEQAAYRRTLVAIPPRQRGPGAVVGSSLQIAPHELSAAPYGGIADRAALALSWAARLAVHECAFPGPRATLGAWDGERSMTDP